MGYQWDEQQYDALTSNQSEIERYLQTRHLVPEKKDVAPYDPPAPETPALERAAKVASNVVVILAKPAAIGVAVVAGAKYVFGVVTVGVAAAGAGMTAWATANGGLLVCGAGVVLLSVVAWAASLFGAGKGERPEIHNHYHQYNNQGPGGQQNGQAK